MIPFPNKKYNIIYADCPWKYTSKSVAPNREVTNYYPTMDIKEIMNLDVKSNLYQIKIVTCFYGLLLQILMSELMY